LLNKNLKDQKFAKSPAEKVMEKGNLFELPQTPLQNFKGQKITVLD
jgi:hypothetical protein